MNRYKFVDYATQGYIAFVALLVLAFHDSRLESWPWVALAHLICLGLIHGLIAYAGKHPDNRLLDFLRHFYPIVLYTAMYRETELLNQMFHAGYWDTHFLRLESRLFGMQPGLELVVRFPSRWLAELLYASYFSYYLMIGGIGFFLLWRDRRQFAHFVSVVSFLFYVCYTIYIFVPVVGPRIVYRGLVDVPLPQDVVSGISADTPESVQSAVFFRIMGWIYDHFEAAGAAFPSSHVAVALCTVYFSFLYLRRVRYLHLVASILLCISTVYGRYHYVVDVVAGVAVAAVLVPLGNWLYRKFDDGVPERVANASPLHPAKQGGKSTG